MLPTSLTAANLSGYPPEARALAVRYLTLLRQLPLAFLGSLLRELIDYDVSFPAERQEIQMQLSYLEGLSANDLQSLFASFRKLTIPPELARADWINKPLNFTEQLSAYLWSSGQMEGFREAATTYGQRFKQATPATQLPLHRLGIAVIGQGAPDQQKDLFRLLRSHGTYFSALIPQNGLAQLLSAVRTRAQSYPHPYAHWYIDGGLPAQNLPEVTAISYAASRPVRDELLRLIQKKANIPGMGPEELRNLLAQLAPRDLGMTGDPVLNRFQLRALTEGSGTQIFSTTFAQWTAREALRRAQPATLLVRFAPRQRQRPMNELLTDAPEAELDPQGSLIDADMAAYYHWINQQRLPGADTSAFLAWFEGTGQAVAIGPTFPRGTVSRSALEPGVLLKMLTA